MDEAHRARLHQSQLDLSRSVEFVIGAEAARLAIDGSSDVHLPPGGTDWARAVWRLQLLDGQGDAIGADALEQGQAMLEALSGMASGSCGDSSGDDTAPVAIGARKLDRAGSRPLQLSQLALTRPLNGRLHSLRFFFAAPFSHIGSLTVHFSPRDSDGPPAPSRPFECPILRCFRQEQPHLRGQIDEMKRLLSEDDAWLGRHAHLCEPRVDSAPWQLRPWQQLLEQAKQQLREASALARPTCLHSPIPRSTAPRTRRPTFTTVVCATSCRLWPTGRRAAHWLS